MVPEHHEDVDTGLVEPTHAIHEVKACLEVTQLPIEDATCQHNEPTAIVNGNQIVEGLTRCCFDARGILSRFTRQS